MADILYDLCVLALGAIGAALVAAPVAPRPRQWLSRALVAGGVGVLVLIVAMS